MINHWIQSFLFFCLVTGITPGSANLCSLYAALIYGRKRALIQLGGLIVGFTIIVMISAVATYFLGEIIGDYVKYLSYIGEIYILWLAWQIFKSNGAENTDDSRNCNFFTGLLINLTNGKIILYIMAAMSAYVLPYTQNFLPLVEIGMILLFAGTICNLMWLFLGVYLQKIFNRHKKIINAAMSLSLVFCALSLVFL